MCVFPTFLLRLEQTKFAQTKKPRKTFVRPEWRWEERIPTDSFWKLKTEKRSWTREGERERKRQNQKPENPNSAQEKHIKRSTKKKLPTVTGSMILRGCYGGRMDRVRQKRQRERHTHRGTEGETNRQETWSHKNKIAKGKRRLKEGRRARTTLARGDSIPAPHLPWHHLSRCRVFVSGLVIFKTSLGVFVYWLYLTLPMKS